jgi:hypothetical protein
MPDADRKQHPPDRVVALLRAMSTPTAPKPTAAAAMLGSHGSPRS